MKVLGRYNTTSKRPGGRIWLGPGPGMSKFCRGRELAVLEFGRGRGREFNKSTAKLELFTEKLALWTSSFQN